MNREIEFRGKRPDTGGWVYGYYCKHTKRQVCPMGDELKPEDIAHLIINDGFADWNMPRSLQGYDVDPETVGQYTGLKDKDGVKIWEGDVLKAINPNGEEDNLCVVKWDNLCGGYPYVPQGGFGDFDVSTVGWAMTMEFTFELIGNIHDNPEFLEVLGND